MPEVVFATHALTETYISGEVAVQTWLPGSLDGFATGAAIGIVIALVVVSLIVNCPDDSQLVIASQ